MPAKIDDLFDEIKESNPSYSDEQAWATAWSVYCKHVEPGSDSCHLPTSEYLKGKTASERVVARFICKIAGWDGKLVGNGFRMTWDQSSIRIEELPAKGKRKLRVAEMLTPFMWTKFDAWLPINLIKNVGKVSASDTYDTAKAKVLDALTADRTLAWLKEEASPGLDPLAVLKQYRTQWNENEVHFLKVVPENVEPFTADGKDFAVSCSWTGFKAYSPDSDLGGGGDPYYTIIESTAAASARKLYQMLKAAPDALKSVPWAKFDDFLKANKVNYEYHHSVWH
jgi:hypothetical protein